jgi:hypothetical protein
MPLNSESMTNKNAVALRYEIVIYRTELIDGNLSADMITVVCSAQPLRVCRSSNHLSAVELAVRSAEDALE